MGYVPVLIVPGPRRNIPASRIVRDYVIDYAGRAPTLTYTRTATLRLFFSTLLTLTAGSILCRADVIDSSVMLPPLDGAYTVPVICAVNGCIVGSILDGFSVISSTETSGNQVVTVNADFSTTVYTNAGGSPGTLLGSISTQGPVTFTYVGRDPSVNPLGSFTTELSNFDFSATLNGYTTEIRQDPSSSSTGNTTINEASTSPVTYDVSSMLTINGDLSINGSPFVQLPPVVTTLSPTPLVPEPAYSAAAGLLLLFLGFKFRRKLA